MEDFNEEAPVCKACGRDLRVVRPLINENLALVARIEGLQLQIGKARVALERAASPIRFWSVHSFAYLVTPVVLLIAAHLLIIIVFDASPIYLRLASIAIPLPFGFALVWVSHHSVHWSILDGIFIGLFSVAGMLTFVAFIDNVSVWPESFREWRETLEYVASIALANVTGSVIGLLARRMLPRSLDATRAPSRAALTIARMAGRNVAVRTLRRRAQKLQDNFRTIATAAAALAAGTGSIYTGIRALLGGF